MQQEIERPDLTRDEARRLVYRLNAMGVKLGIVAGRIVPWPPLDSAKMPAEAARLLREHWAAIRAYLTTPPEDNSPCAACGRVGFWRLDPVGVWVCDCYFHPSLRTWPPERLF